MAAVLLKVVNLTKSYGARRAVAAVSFQVQAGQTVGLIGPNGAGKSMAAQLGFALLAVSKFKRDQQ